MVRSKEFPLIRLVSGIVKDVFEVSVVGWG